MDKITSTWKRDGLSVDTDRADFALSLKTYRLRRGLTQAQLAEEWNTSRYTILRAEGAKPISWEVAYKLFAKLARALEEEK